MSFGGGFGTYYVVKRLLKKLGPGAAAQTFMAFAFWSKNAAAATDIFFCHAVLLECS